MESSGCEERRFVTSGSVEPQGCSYASREACCSDSHRETVTRNCVGGCTTCRVYATDCICYDAACAVQ